MKVEQNTCGTSINLELIDSIGSLAGKLGIEKTELDELIAHALLNSNQGNSPNISSIFRYETSHETEDEILGYSEQNLNGIKLLYG